MEEKDNEYTLIVESEATESMNVSESLTQRTTSEKVQDVKFTLAIAYNNGAIEYEHLGKPKEALDFFLNATIIAEKVCGKDDERTLQFKKRYDELRAKE